MKELVNKFLVFLLNENSATIITSIIMIAVSVPLLVKAKKKSNKEENPQKGKDSNKIIGLCLD